MVELDQAVAWPIDVRGTQVNVPLLVRFFAADELELLD